MRRLPLVLAYMVVASCSPSAEEGNPRERVGDQAAPATWGAVRQNDGLAAYLSRPGTAPDLVFWCRNNSQIILRAHVFKAPSAAPDLRLDTGGGAMVFSQVRRQGGVRDGDRTLVEGFGALSDPKVKAIISGANQVTLRSGAETYVASNADPQGVMTGFATDCLALPPQNNTQSVQGK